MASTTTDRRLGLNASAAIKVPCKAATTANITLSGEQTIDGVSCVDGDRVLVKDQTTSSQNGIYLVDTSAWQRDKDWDGALDVKKGTVTYVHSGSTNTGFWYVSTSDPITPGTTSVTIARASSVLAAVSTFVQTLLDDATADAFVQTLVGSLTAETAPATDDVVLLGDTSESAGNKMTLQNMLKVVNSLTEDTSPDQSSDYVLTYDTSASAAKKVAPSNLVTAAVSTCEGRITLTTATPVTTSDVTAATTIYFTPYKGNRIALFNGTSTWNVRTFSELSLAVPATTSTMYDLFVYDNSGTPALEALAWTNDTTRATALTLQNGVLVKTGATTRRYVGSFRTTTSSGQTEDSIARRFVWNYYNRIKRVMRVVEAENSWQYTTATYRQARANTANQLDFIVGYSEDSVYAQVMASGSNVTADVEISVGIGLDSTSTNSAQIIGYFTTPGGTAENHFPVHAIYDAPIAVGRHTLVWLEYSEAAGTTTWLGDGNTTFIQSGIFGHIFG